MNETEVTNEGTNDEIILTISEENKQGYLLIQGRLSQALLLDTKLSFVYIHVLVVYVVLYVLQ